MTNANLPAEPLRAEHRDLLPHLQGLDTIADEVDRWDADEAAATVADRFPDDTLARDLTHQFVGPSAILLLHFR